MTCHYPLDLATLRSETVCMLVQCYSHSWEGGGAEEAHIINFQWWRNRGGKGGWSPPTFKNGGAVPPQFYLC